MNWCTKYHYEIGLCTSHKDGIQPAFLFDLGMKPLIILFGDLVPYYRANLPALPLYFLQKRLGDSSYLIALMINISSAFNFDFISYGHFLNNIIL